MDENISGPASRVIRMYDGKGARVFEGKFTVTSPNQLIDINVSRFGSGLYYVEITDASGKPLKKGKLLVE
jgi:hypothetical protein